MLLVFAFASALVLSSCGANAYKMNRLEVGMTKQEVVKKIGKLISTAAKEGDSTYLMYSFREPGCCFSDSYFVKLINNKVESFGRPGDFDTKNSLHKSDTIYAATKKLSGLQIRLAVFCSFISLLATSLLVASVS